jgi:hypothetical protein
MQLTHHSKIAKHDNRFRRQHDDWRRAYHESSSVRERFPRVEECVVCVAFSDVQRYGTYSPLMHSFSPSAKAFFAVACPRTLCLDGGFDLDAIIVKLLGSAGQVATGTLDCAGQMQRLLPADAICRLRMRYSVRIRYAPAARD